MDRFRDRRHAGRLLAALLKHYKQRPDLLVLALPRGGVPVGYEIAQALHAPLDVLIVRKLGVPGHEELAMGAIASGGVRVLHTSVIQMIGISEAVIDNVAQEEEQEIMRREEVYRGHRPLPQIQDRIVVLVDDGLATGSTMRAAIAAVRQQRPKQVIVAVPVASPDTCEELHAEADEVYCALTPALFFGVGQWYESFPQMSDEEVRELLDQMPAAKQE
jgi:putative phosphoribosyl transferase